MCIAIASPAGTKLPDRKYLKNCFSNNPDGAGIAFSIGDKVKIEKGFMKWSAFTKRLDELEKEYDLTNRGVLLHFRIQTHGGVNQECCHPFPLSNKEEDLQNTRIDSEYAVVHNGIISLTSATAKKEKKMSDTMCYIRDILWNISRIGDWFTNPATWKLVLNTAESKIACMDKDGTIQMTEGFTQDADGNFYSNDSYKTVIEKQYYQQTMPMWPQKLNHDLEKYPLMKIRGGCKSGDDCLFKEFGNPTAYYMPHSDMYVDSFFNLWKAPACGDGEPVTTKMDGDKILDKLSFYGRGMAIYSDYTQKLFKADCYVDFKNNRPNY